MLFKRWGPVVRSVQVKEPLKAPFILLFILLCATVVLSALNLIYTWGMYDSATRSFGLPYIAQRLPRSVFEVLIPAVVLSIVLLGFRMARRPFSRFLGLVIVLGVSYVVLVNGMLWCGALGAKAQPSREAPRQYVQPFTFFRVGDSRIAVRSIADSALKGILVFDAAKAKNRFSVYAAGTASTRAGTLTVTAEGRPPVAISGTPELSASSVFAADRLTGLFLRDIHTLTTDFERLLAKSVGQFFAACFALLFLCTASLAFLRLTRWPLANIMLLVIAVRGYFSLYHLLAVSLAPQIAQLVTDRLLAQMFPAVALAALGVVLLLVDIIYIPADRWLKEKPL